MRVRDIIEEKLKLKFSPTYIEVHDESHMHAGHAGAPDGGQSHFRILVVSADFEGLNSLKRQRAVNACLKEELAGKIHALSMSLKTPDQYIG
jgi:BolA protein